MLLRRNRVWLPYLAPFLTAARLYAVVCTHTDKMAEAEPKKRTFR